MKKFNISLLLTLMSVLTTWGQSERLLRFSSSRENPVLFDRNTEVILETFQSSSHLGGPAPHLPVSIKSNFVTTHSLKGNLLWTKRLEPRQGNIGTRLNWMISDQYLSNHGNTLIVGNEYQEFDYVNEIFITIPFLSSLNSYGSKITSWTVDSLNTQFDRLEFTKIYKNKNDDFIVQGLASTLNQPLNIVFLKLTESQKKAEGFIVRTPFNFRIPIPYLKENKATIWCKESAASSLNILFELDIVNGTVNEETFFSYIDSLGKFAYLNLLIIVDTKLEDFLIC